MFKSFVPRGDPNRIRTYDLQIRNLLLYPAELWDHREYFRGANMQIYVQTGNSRSLVYVILSAGQILKHRKS